MLLLALTLGCSSPVDTEQSDPDTGDTDSVDTGGRADATLELTSVPAHCATEGSLVGLVRAETPEDLAVACFIWVQGWWTKPAWASPSTPVEVDGSWSCDVTTTPTDAAASELCAVLLPADAAVPLAAGEPSLPDTLWHAALDLACTSRWRTLSWSGRSWQVKDSCGVPFGPGSCAFTGDTERIWVDGEDRLHLTTAVDGDGWSCTELVGTEPLGHGDYAFTLATPAHDLDPRAVLGLFTYDLHDAAYAHREIDVELSRWGDAEDANAQYVLQPWEADGHLHRFTVGDQVPVTHAFRWGPGRIDWRTEAEGEPLHQWSYAAADVPPQGNEVPRLNLWLIDGRAESRGDEVVVSRFEHTP